MDFSLRFFSRVEERYRDVRLEITGLSPQPITVDLDRLAEGRAGSERSFDIDSSRYPLQLGISANFRETQSTVKTTAEVYNGAGLDIIQLWPTYILAHFSHGRISMKDGQCTVKCETTGESRSGRNVCIECPAGDGKGVIKICC